MEETQRYQRRVALRAAVPATIPVMTGFLCLGVAYGVLMQSKGYGPGWGQHAVCGCHAADHGL